MPLHTKLPEGLKEVDVIVSDLEFYDGALYATDDD